MKLYNVTLEVKIVEIPSPPEFKSLSETLESIPKDSPARDIAHVMQAVASSAMPSGPVLVRAPQYYPGGGNDGMNMTESVQVAGDGFEDMQAILKKFHETARSLTPEGAQ